MTMMKEFSDSKCIITLDFEEKGIDVTGYGYGILVIPILKTCLLKIMQI